MIGDAFVFDAVTHLYNMTAANARNSGGELFNRHLYGFHGALTPTGKRSLLRGNFSVIGTWIPSPTLFSLRALQTCWWHNRCL